MFGNHLVGLYEKALSPDMDWTARLKTAKELGFDYMEISIDESDERISRLYWRECDIERLRRICSEAGIRFQSMCLSAHRRFPFGSSDPVVRHTAYEIMDKAIDFSLAMGIRVIQLAGYDVYYEPSTPQSIRCFREGIEWAVQQASRKQVMLAMEIMDTPFINSISKHMAYEAMLRSPWFKVYPDLGNLSAWPENDVCYELKHGIDSIVAVHLKDTVAVSDVHPGRFKGVPFGGGCVDFVRGFAQLDELGYTGPYMVEMWSSGSSSDNVQVAQALSWLKERYEEGRRLLQ